MGRIEAAKSTLTRANGLDTVRVAALDPARARAQLRAHLVAHLTTHLEPGERHTLEVLDGEGRTIEAFTKLHDGPYRDRQA